MSPSHLKACLAYKQDELAFSLSFLTPCPQKPKTGSESPESRPVLPAPWERHLSHAGLNNFRYQMRCPQGSQKAYPFSLYLRVDVMGKYLVYNRCSFNGGFHYIDLEQGLSPSFLSYLVADLIRRKPSRSGAEHTSVSCWCWGVLVNTYYMASVTWM